MSDCSNCHQAGHDAEDCRLPMEDMPANTGNCEKCGVTYFFLHGKFICRCNIDDLLLEEGGNKEKVKTLHSKRFRDDTTVMGVVLDGYYFDPKEGELIQVESVKVSSSKESVYFRRFEKPVCECSLSHFQNTYRQVEVDYKPNE
jgi:hypothetical protein